MMKIAILLATIVAVAYGLNEASYCNLNTCRGPHTLCQYRSKAPQASCNVISAGLTSDEKQKVLNLHNQLRQKVASGQEYRGLPGPQPVASNMQQLEWDDELAEIAQRWANQCNFNHDTCRDVKQYQVGQNIAISGTSGDVSTITAESLVQMWYDEVKDYSASSVSRFSDLNGANGQQIGHYTQLVWAKTTKLGCGALKYRSGGFNNFYLVCNYGPSGNWLGEPVYATL